MRKACLLMTFLILLLCVSRAGWTKMVHYIDENGKTHYVNTDFRTIPPQYLDQVRSQLREDTTQASDVPPDEDQDTASGQETEEAEPVQEDAAAVPLIDVFVADDCDECPVFLQELIINKISYRRFDVHEHAYGKKMYGRHPGILPFTKVGDRLIRGRNVKEVSAAIKKLREQMANQKQQVQDVDAQ
jgi:hypothetical protein